MTNVSLLRKEVFRPSSPDSAEAELMQPLLLSEDLKIHERRDDLLVVKNIRNKTYLVVTKAEWKLLQRYSKPISLLDLFLDLIRDRACPPLSELFELLLKARRRFILVTLGTKGPVVAPADWKYRLNYPLAHFFSLLVILFGALSMGYRINLAPPDNLILFTALLAAGWVFVCVCLSVGNFLSASLLTAFEGEVFSPRLNVGTLFPHFDFNRRDAVMGGRSCETGMAQVEVAPMFLYAGTVIWLLPEASLIAYLGVFYVMAPLKNSPATRFIHAFFRGPQRSVATEFALETGDGPLGRLKRSLHFLKPNSVIIEVLYALGWMVVAGALGYLVFWDSKVGETIRESGSGETTSVVSLILIVVLAVAILSVGFSKLFLRLLSSFRKAERKGQGDVNFQGQELQEKDVNREVMKELIGAMPFSQSLSPETINLLTARAQYRFYESDQVLYEPGDTLSHYPIVLFGSLVQEQVTRTGRISVIRTIGAAETFGEDELIDAKPIEYQVRAQRSTCVVFLDRETFHREVISRVGRQRMQEIMQKEGLLREIRLSRSWTPETVQRFAKLVVVNEYPDGSVVLPRGFDNRFFYIVYQGVFSVRLKKKIVARLRRGDFFGEISLLQNSQTTSEVVAEEKARAFTVSKGDFLRFMVTDFSVALQIERIASRRLGHPIFPLGGRKKKR